MQLIRRQTFVLASCALAATFGTLQVAGCNGDDSTSSGSDASTPPPPPQPNPPPPNPNPPPPPPKDSGQDVEPCLGATDAATLDEASIQAGHDFVLGYKCYGCHQSQPLDSGIFLNGRLTSLVDGGAIYPKNLTPDHDFGIGCWTDPQITNAILNAIDDQDASLCVMPKFSTKGMDAGTAKNIADFLRTLPASSQNVPESTCPPPSDAGSDAADAADADGG